MSKQLNATYQCSNGPVFLSVKVGNGQLGGSAVFVGNSSKPLAVDLLIDRLDVGNGQDLAASKIFVKSVVADVSDLTNKMIVTYRLEGGPSVSTFQLTDEVENDGDSAAFRATFHFETV